jgi:transcriptional regulator GlxA family with amidase domain
VTSTSPAAWSERGRGQDGPKTLPTRGETSLGKRYSLLVAVRTSSRNFAVLLFDEVELLDVASMMQVASLAGRHYNWRPFRLLPVARAAGLVETRSQLRLEAKFSFEDCPAPELLFVPGGYGARRTAHDAQAIAWCKQVAPAAALTLAIGSGVAVLGAAGLLDGASVATTSETRAWLAGSLPNTRLDEPEPVVATLGGKLLSAASSGQGVELALAMVERQLGKKLAAAVRTQLGAVAVARLELPEPPAITLPRP